MFRTPTLAEGSLEKPSSRSADRSRARTSDPVLLLLHQKTSCAGAVADWLERQGYHLEFKYPTLGDELPDTLQYHAGLIVFGGLMSVNDECPEMNKEIDWLSLALKEKTPYFGICLGAQMMARQLGSEVVPHKKKLVEIGYHPVTATSEGKKLIKHWPERFFQWHNEGFKLPRETQALATGTRFENQAFSYNDHVFGVQFHPEITTPIIQRWTTSTSKMLTKKGAHIKERLLADHQKYGQAQLDWLSQFMDHWTSLIARR